MAATIQRSYNGLNKPCILLIVIAGMERFAYKGVASNMVTYLTDVVKMSNSAAAKTVNSWCGFTSIVPLLIATLADSYWDHYTTILVFSFLYLLGLMALTSTSLVWAWMPTNKTSSSLALYWSLYMISLGQGGYNPSLQAFGADQLVFEDTDDPHLPSTKNDETTTKKPNNTRSLFFQWWYFGICSGSLLGVSLMSYVQDTIGWSIGFAIPTMAMVASIVFFSCGTRFYHYKQAKDVDVKPFETIFCTIKSTASRYVSGCCKQEEHTNELELQEKPLCKKGYSGRQEEELSSDDEISPKSCSVLENVRVVIRLLPIWAMLLTFAVVFQQPATFFTKQGVTMKRNIGQNFKIPPAALQSAITISIIILMPLYDKVLIPFTQMITRQNRGISVMQRMGIGMVLSVVAMIIAAVIETRRRTSTVDLSIFWLLPQYILLGISDIFTVVGMQEFFYSEVPVTMRTMGIALYTSVFGVGSFMSAFLIGLIEFFTRSDQEKGGDGWFSDDMKEARLDKYYWLLAIMSSLSLLLYTVLCRFFRSMNDTTDNDKL